MWIYVNGDSHTAAAEAVNSFAFAEDDSRYVYMGRVAHPDNLSVSWGRVLSDIIKTSFKCDAESASSNQRIIRTTQKWLAQQAVDDVLVIIQWSTWERQEWLIDGTYYQINASGIDDVPESHQERYKEYVASIDWPKATESAHQLIWDFHLELDKQKVKHIFFNGNNHFGNIPKDQQLNWGNSYIAPYSAAGTFDSWLKTHKFTTVTPKSWHFGKTAHAAWAQFMLQYIVQNQYIN